MPKESIGFTPPKNSPDMAKLAWHGIIVFKIFRRDKGELAEKSENLPWMLE